MKNPEVESFWVPTKAIDKKDKDDVFPSKGIILKEKDMSPLKIRYMRLWV